MNTLSFIFWRRVDINESQRTTLRLYLWRNMESSKRIMVVLELDEDNNAEVVFTKNLIQTKEDFEDCEVVGKFSI